LWSVTNSLLWGCEAYGFGSVHPLRGMARPDRYAEKASQEIEVAGRKLRTSNPDHIRRMMLMFEVRSRLDPNFKPCIEDRSTWRGAAYEAIRLKKGIA